MFKRTHHLAIAGLALLMAGSISVQSVPANAAIGVFMITSAAKNGGDATLGAVLAALGAGVVGLGLSSTQQKQCTPEAPCFNADLGQSLTPCPGGGNLCVTGLTPDGEDFAGTLTSGSVPYSSPNMTEILVGLVLLGTERAPEANLLAITSQMATEMDMTSPEVVAFNHERTQINLLVNDFTSRLNGEASRSKMNHDQLKAAALKLWDTEAKPVLSSDAYNAAKKAGAVYSSLLMGK